MRRRMAEHPNSVSFNEAGRVLEAFDWWLHHVKGSDHTFRRGSGRIVIPLRRPCILPAYVRQILAATAGDDDESSDDA